MIIVVAAPVVDPPPTAPPAPAPAEAFSHRVRWTSWDGRYWDLTDFESPLFLVSWLEGLGPTDADHWWKESPTVDGASWDGLHVGAGSVSLELLAYTDDSTEVFLTEHGWFKKSLNPRKEGTIRLTRPDGSWLEKVCRYESGANMAHTIDPAFSRTVRYVITWATADPYWLGEPVVWSVEFDATAADFYPGPPWTLTSSQVLGGPDAAVDNEGDVDAYPVWRIDGPFAGFTAGVGTSLVTSTLTKPLGGWVEIDMRPNKLTVLDEAGVDRWPTLTEARFSSIPPGVSHVVTTANGAAAGSKVTLSFTPRFEGAF